MTDGSRRPLLVLVGPASKARADLAHHLIDRDAAIVICSGPPGCRLLRGERCALVDTADAIVQLPTDTRDRDVVTGLTLCAQRASMAVVMEPSPIPREVGAVRVRTTVTAEAARTVTSILRHPSATRFRDERLGDRVSRTVRACGSG